MRIGRRRVTCGGDGEGGWGMRRQSKGPEEDHVEGQEKMAKRS